jgi:tRNA (cytidine56-2'-O)-methyltransferase
MLFLMKIVVLRLGHRIFRDKRLTTHVALTARALGADGAVISGEEDAGIIESVKDIADRWGGKFTVFYEKEWHKFLKEKRREGWEILHLSMYGLPYQKELPKIRKSKKNKLIVVGSEKVPPEVYQIADYNLSVTNQPHSEVAALALFLHDFFKGKELNKKFAKPKIKIVPQKCGKKTLKF